jgi:hypothetical protein
VNDAPSFAKGPNQTVNEAAGPQSVANWAAAIAAGPPNESGQVLHFEVSNSNPALFAAGGQPGIAPNGTLAYTPAAGPNGTATVTVVLKDDGGIANGGIDASAPQTFTIRVNNVAPVVGSVGATPNVVAVNSPVAVSAQFTDVGMQDVHTASIAWGDGATTSATVSELNGSGSVAGSHSYASAGGNTGDKFRIKIWNKNAGDAVVYDNQMAAALDADATTLIDGGSIVVHAAKTNGSK